MEIILYTKPNCPECKRAKSILQENKVEFILNQNLEEVKEAGFKFVPVAKVEGKFYDKDEIFKNITDWILFSKKENRAERTMNGALEPIDGRKLMSAAKFYEGYSRFLDGKDRYETWEESVNRVINMHREFYKDKMTQELSDLLSEVENAYSQKLFLGAQRALQFGGKQLLAKHGRLYNCSSSYCNRPDFFGGFFYFLLCGCGVGFSVQNHHINQLPEIQKRNRAAKTYVVPDSIEGWATTIDVLLSSYFVGGGVYPEYEGRRVYFDLSNIRPKDSFISGGFKAPGPDPLRKALDKVEYLIEQELRNDKKRLESIVLYDICMYVADAVISGGVRRSATICLFSKDDEDMMCAKTGNWFVENPQRGRSNNSVVLLRDDTTFDEFEYFIQSVKEFGEPGFIWTDDLDFIFNPCAEISMKPVTSDGRNGYQLCNLTEINGSKSTTKEIFFEQCKYASILGTLQAGYTEFTFLKDATKEIVEREALIGVGITGMMNNPDILFDESILKEGAEIVKFWNKKIANIIGINQAARTTTIKPSGNSAVLLECSSGIHGEHSKQYIRNVQFSKNSEVAELILEKTPCMCEDSVWNRERDMVVSFPIISNGKSIYKKDLLGIKQLEYVKFIQQTWIESGTNVELCVDKRLRHNVSNTITVDDWDSVTKYIYDNRHYLCGVSLLSAFGDKAYPQAPFTEVLETNDIMNKYGQMALFTSALIEAGLTAFNNDLWAATSTALGYGEKLCDERSDLLKRDFVRRFKKFASNFKNEEECADCLKDVYNAHKFWKINKNIENIDWINELSKKTFLDINTTGAIACGGGQCEV